MKDEPESSTDSLIPSPQPPTPNPWQRLLKFGFHLLYNEMAWSYDLVSWAVSFGHWRVWQEASLAFVVGPRVLEIAHGPGHMLGRLHGRGIAAVGLDLSLRMSRLAQGRLHKAGLAAAVPLLRCQVQALPFVHHSFDTVLSQFPTDFILQAITLRNIYQILDENGRLVILPEGHLTEKGVIYRLIDWLFRVTGQRPQAEEPEEARWRPFQQALTAAGFEATLHVITLEGSEAIVIVGQKNR